MNLNEIIAINGPEFAQGVSMAIKGRKAKNTLKEQEGIMESLMDDRQDLINPTQDMTNPYANLSVATQAAQMKAQEADQALANTLDTLRATGTGAGGATALARAAAQSKQGVAATIEQQEVANEQLRAKGQQQLEQYQAEGEMFKFQNQEAREDEKIYFAQRKADRAQMENYAYQARAGEALTGSLGGEDGIISSVLGGLPIDQGSIPGTIKK